MVTGEEIVGTVGVGKGHISAGKVEKEEAAFVLIVGKKLDTIEVSIAGVCLEKKVGKVAGKTFSSN